MNDLFGNEEIRALSWRQPFGSLMFHGKIETRRWRFFHKYKGLVLICLSAQKYSDSDLTGICSGAQIKMIENVLKNEPTATLNGFAVGVGRLVQTRWMNLEDQEKTFVSFDEELQCHIYQNVRRIKPFPFKNGLGFRRVDEQTRALIELL